MIVHRNRIVTEMDGTRTRFFVHSDLLTILHAISHLVVFHAGAVQRSRHQMPKHERLQFARTRYDFGELGVGESTIERREQGERFAT